MVQGSCFFLLRIAPRQDTPWYHTRMAIKVVDAVHLPEGAVQSAIAEAETIFWQTASVAEFSSEAEQHAFWYRYFGYYRQRSAELLLLAMDQEGVAGYICGVSDTRLHSELYDAAPHVAVFDDLYGDFPAHLHINVHERTRGQGIGGELIEAYCERVRDLGAAGVHLVTSVGVRNVSFYLRHGFVHTVARNTPDTGAKPSASELLFMGRRLS